MEDINYSYLNYTQKCQPIYPDFQCDSQYNLDVVHHQDIPQQLSSKNTPLCLGCTRRNHSPLHHMYFYTETMMFLLSKDPETLHHNVRDVETLLKESRRQKLTHQNN